MKKISNEKIYSVLALKGICQRSNKPTKFKGFPGLGVPKYIKFFVTQGPISSIFLLNK